MTVCGDRVKICPLPTPPVCQLIPAAGQAAPAVGKTTNGVQAERQPDDEDEFCDVLTAAVFSRELTDLLLESVPTLTGRQITQLRHSLIEFGERHGWVEN
jgi:hypothetical protein